MSIIYHQNEIANWYDLLLNAQLQTDISLDQEIEVYLAFMIKKSIRDLSIVDTIIAINYLEALKFTHSRRMGRLRTTAEYGLLLSTLFPHIARKRNISDSYYADMSQVAYSDLIDVCVGYSPELVELYKKVLDNFNDILSVMLAFRSLGTHVSDNKIVDSCSKLSFDDCADVNLKTLLN